MPFLDRQVIAFAFGLPMAWKQAAPGEPEKRMLRARVQRLAARRDPVAREGRVRRRQRRQGRAQADDRGRASAHGDFERERGAIDPPLRTREEFALPPHLRRAPAGRASRADARALRDGVVPGPPPRRLAASRIRRMAGPLAGRVALVAGATRGAGRGTAVALGEAGATVYCTGRSTRAHRSEYDRPETIEETAELVGDAGGTGIAVEVDHLQAEQVAALVARIEAEQGRLDVLVNDIWGGEQLTEWNVSLWESDLDRGLRMLRLAIDTHLITSHFALSLLIRRRGGLVVEIDRRHARLQRSQLPPVDVLRPRQDGRDPARVRAGAGARAARLRGGRADAGLDALGDDARHLRRHRADVARGAARQPALQADLRVDALRRPRGRRARRRSRRDPTQRRLVLLRRPRAGVRLHRHRRLAPGCMALHGRGAGRRPAARTRRATAKPHQWQLLGYIRPLPASRRGARRRSHEE